MEIVTDLPKWYTMDEVAEILGVSRSTVSRLMRDPKHPLPVRYLGKRYVCIQKDLNDYATNLPFVNGGKE